MTRIVKYVDGVKELNRIYYKLIKKVKRRSKIQVIIQLVYDIRLEYINPYRDETIIYKLK